MDSSEHPPSPDELRTLRDEFQRIREVQSIGLMPEADALSLCEEVIISTVQNRLLALLIQYQEYVLRCHNKREISLRISEILNGAPVLQMSELNILRNRLLNGHDIPLRALETIIGDVPMDKFPGLVLSVSETGKVSLLKIR